MIHNTKFLRLIGGHEVVTVQGFFDRVVIAAGMPGLDIVQPLLDLHDIFGVTNNIGCLALEAAGRLMDHDSRVRQRVTRFCLSGAKEKRTHRGGLSDAKCRYLGLYELHRIIDRKARRHHTARRIG